MNRRAVLGSLGGLALGAAEAGAAPAARPDDVPLPAAKAVPAMQALPLPHDEASIQRRGVELTRYHFAPTLRRPFLYPVIGPSGRSLTRVGHPHAPVSHRHHNSVWAAHNDVDGDDFWAQTGPGRILHQWTVEYTDGEAAASIVAVNHWVGKQDRVHLVERRGMRALSLPARGKGQRARGKGPDPEEGEWLLQVDIQLETPAGAARPVTLGKTPFGLFAVRMAKTIGVNDGGGLIRNSEGNMDEQGPNGVFWKRARWVDYSGPILPGVHEGITFFDHPANPNHPTYFHVRADGWMGASLTFDGPRTIEPGRPLLLRYGLYVHRGVPAAGVIDQQWKQFAGTAVEALPNFRK